MMQAMAYTERTSSSTSNYWWLRTNCLIPCFAVLGVRRGRRWAGQMAACSSYQLKLRSGSTHQLLTHYQPCKAVGIAGPAAVMITVSLVMPLAANCRSCSCRWLTLYSAMLPSVVYKTFQHCVKGTRTLLPVTYGKRTEPWTTDTPCSEPADEASTPTAAILRLLTRQSDSTHTGGVFTMPREFAAASYAAWC